MSGEVEAQECQNDPSHSKLGCAVAVDVAVDDCSLGIHPIRSNDSGVLDGGEVPTILEPSDPFLVDSQTRILNECQFELGVSHDHRVLHASHVTEAVALQP